MLESSLATTPEVFPLTDLDLSAGVMNDIASDELIEAWETLLAHQARMFGPYEVQWLRENGFGAPRVLEIGSALGEYGSFIARSFPKTRLLGVEANPQFVARARRLPRNYSIDACVLGQSELPASLATGVDQVLARYVLQHVSDPTTVLRSAHDLLPRGGRLFVVEEDDAFFTSTGCSGFDRVTDAWRKICREQGTDSAIGRKLPELLAKTGFHVERFEIRLRTNHELGAAFFDFFAMVARVLHLSSPKTLRRAAMERAIELLEASKRELPRGPVATYPHVFALATRL